MFKNVDELDLNYLKKNHTRLYYFGLGFIQLKLDEAYRLHFYHPSLPRLVETPHNHRYDFTSRILSGEFTNTRYELLEGSTHHLVKESCVEGKKAAVKPKPVSARILDATTYRAGEQYFMPHGEFHTVEAKECITLLSRSRYKKEFAEILTENGAISICPFSMKMTETDLWALIEKMITKGRRHDHD